MFPADCPTPLRVAVALVALEGLGLLGYGLANAVHTGGADWVVGLSTAAFFCLYGVALLLCARALGHRHTWARGPVVVTQLFCLGLAWNFAHGRTWPAAVPLALLGVAGLVSILHPGSREALEH